MVTDRIKSFSALCARAETGASQRGCYCVYTVAMTYWLVSLRRSLRIDISKSTDPIHVPFGAACRCICQLHCGPCCSPIARKLIYVSSLSILIAWCTFFQNIIELVKPDQYRLTLHHTHKRVCVKKQSQCHLLFRKPKSKMFSE